MNNQLILSLISGIFIGSVAAYLGTLMLSRKMSVVAGPLAHLTLPGAALSIIYGFSLFIGIFPFVLLGVFLIWLLERKTKLPIENLTAIIFAFGIGLALLILPIKKAEAALIGNINHISFAETIFVVLISSVVLFLTQKIYSQIMLININEDLAQSTGINVRLYNFLYLLNVGLIIALGVYLVGGLITVALVAIPAAFAKNISLNLKNYKIWSVFAGISSTILGILLNYFYGFPAGPLIIISGGVLFLISVLIKIFKK
ncbi:MAG: metal ABC transporter permease [Minisyncoccia bacterium]